MLSESEIYTYAYLIVTDEAIDSAIKSYIPEIIEKLTQDNDHTRALLIATLLAKDPLLIKVTYALYNDREIKRHVDSTASAIGAVVREELSRKFPEIYKLL